MTVILVGKSPTGNLIVTDAKVPENVTSKSNNQYGLTDKIQWLRCAQSYCSLVGNSIVLDGLEFIDNWYLNKNTDIDFSKTKVMQDALTATEKFREIRVKEGCKLMSNEEANIYFVNKEQVFEYEIVLKKNKYFIDNFRFFKPNEVVIRYGYILERLTNFAYPNELLFDKAKECIESVHKKWKRKAKIDKNIGILEYEFDNRFCGVVFSKKKNEKERFYSPFNKLSDAIAAAAETPKMTWELIEDEKFSWSPDDTKNSK